MTPLDDPPDTERLLPARGSRWDALAVHRSLAGPLPLPLPGRDHRTWAAGLLAAIESAGLTGRGGAGFPTARKLALASASGRSPLLVVNAMEGEPASLKDTVLLSENPHLVLDGAELVAAMIGARQVALCLPAGRSALASRLQHQVRQRQLARMDPAPLEVLPLPERFLAGEESALVDALAGGPGLPRFRETKSVPLHLGHRPALVHNPETLAHVALVARYGPAWFGSVGAPEAPGTALVTISGCLGQPGVVEVETGTPILSILERGTIMAPLGAVLVGGYGGSWLPPSAAELPYAPAALLRRGAVMGAGILVALPAGSCGLAETARLATYLAGQGAGQCGPCVFGLPAIAADLQQLAAGRPSGEVMGRLQGRLEAVSGRGGCRHPDGAARLVRSALAVFAADLRGHLAGRPCAGARCPSVLRLPDGPGRRP